jgi:hypothetical protein
MSEPSDIEEIDFALKAAQLICRLRAQCPVEPQLNIAIRLLPKIEAELERLKEERDLWVDRYQAEMQAHMATMKYCDEHHQDME